MYSPLTFAQRQMHGKALLKALELVRRCEDVPWYGVGAVIVDERGEVCSSGYTNEVRGSDGSSIHAEELAIIRAISEGVDLRQGTLYSTLEPCSERSSEKLSCSRRIIESGIRRVVFGAKEPFDPALGIVCQGAENLSRAGIEVIELEELSDVCLREAVRRSLNSSLRSGS